MALRKNNLRRLLLTFEALADLGPVLTGDADLEQTAHSMLRATLDAVEAREGAIFYFSDKPALLRSVAVQGFAAIPDPAVIPLLPRHAHTLTTVRGPQILAPGANWDAFLSLNGNVAPQLFHCLAPLNLRSRLVGVIALGRPQGEAYDEEALEVLALLAHYVAVALHNHWLSQTLEQRISENLKLLASVNSFYDQALEAFAAASDIKHVNIHGHSVRVGRYAAAIGEAMGLDPTEVAGLRAAGFLHDIGKVAIDKRLFGKPERLDEREFQEIADHTVIGHRIVANVQFPWAHVAEVVRSHHERADGTGYPDQLRLEETSLPARIVAVADTFDAMTSERPWRQRLTVGAALSELVRIAPEKYDPAAVQALLVQVRRDAVDPARNRLLEAHSNLSPGDVDHLASELNFRLTQGRTYLA